MLLDRKSLSITRACSTDDTQGALMGICVEKDGTTIATNAHWLAVVTPAGQNESEFPVSKDGAKPIAPDSMIIPTATVKAALKSIPKKSMPILQNVQLCQNGGLPQLVTTDLDNAQTHSFRPVDSTYPDWRKIVPVDAEGDRTVCFDAHLLKAICETAIEFSDKAFQVGITFRLGEKAKTSASRATVTHDGRTLSLVLMPLRLPE